MRRSVIAIGAGVWLAAMAYAQAPAFEVASVKPAVTAEPGHSGKHTDKGIVRIDNYSLKQLIEAAYGVKDYSLVGPAWLDEVRFDVVAKVPEGGDEDQIPAMLQSLLKERFKLEVHQDSKVMNGLGMSVDKKGLKIQPVEAGNSQTSGSRNGLTAKKITMERLADRLSGIMGNPVKDLTGLTEVYDLVLKWTPEEAPKPKMDEKGSAMASDPGVSIRTAVEDQLGLKLVPQKVTVTILLVDHAERVPTEN
jgi:uncharacterized protein (TIGR03435 family)